MVKQSRKILIAYLAIISSVFIGAYILLHVREMGLYLVMFAINLPVSILIFPIMEKIATVLGWNLGETPHILITQVASTLANAALLLIVLAGARTIRGVFKARDGAD